MEEEDFECGKGWYPIIHEVLNHINRINETIEDEEKKIKVVQIKEKFGGLRIYVDNRTDELHDIIRQAEEKAHNTCELCGSTEKVGVLNMNGWIYGICQSCAKEIVEKRAAKTDRIKGWFREHKKDSEAISWEDLIGYKHEGSN